MGELFQPDPPKIIRPNYSISQASAAILKLSKINLTSDLLAATEFFDEKAFFPAVSTELSRCDGRFLLQSTYARNWRVGKMRNELVDGIKRGVRICTFIQEPLPHERSTSDVYSVRDVLRSIGVHVNLIERIHVKVLIFDEDVSYVGSLNALSQNESGEEMMRWKDRAMAQRMIETHKLLECEECKANRTPGEEALKNGQAAKYIAEVFRQRRKELNLKQEELAAHCALSQTTISKIEMGNGLVAMETLQRVASCLGLSFRFIPDYLESRLHSNRNIRP